MSNLAGSEICCFLKAGDQKEYLVGTINYTNSYIEFSKPRTIEAYIYDLPNFGTLNTLEGVKSLKELHSEAILGRRVIALHSRAPTFNPITKSYSLNFSGRAKVKSIKNCILECASHPGIDTVLFAKVSTNEYVLDFVNPVYPFIAFAIALTNFNGKIINE